MLEVWRFLRLALEFFVFHLNLQLKLLCVKLEQFLRSPRVSSEWFLWRLMLTPKLFIGRFYRFKRCKPSPNTRIPALLTVPDRPAFKVM
jgi:hypothetical protein